MVIFWFCYLDGVFRLRSEDVIELGFFRLCWVCLEVGLLGVFILGFVLVIGFLYFGSI